ncbi:MAG: tetratricopeptide repeat protein, partial [Halieaceae bacterium]|nr:tetratricopeptide repeat protein [Halieaceae bacterium]
MMKEDPKQVLSVDEALSKAKKLSKKGKYLAAFEMYSLILETDPSNRIAKKACKKLLPLVGSKSSLKEEVIQSKSSLFEEKSNTESIESFGANFTESDASKYVLELIGKNEFDHALNSALNFLKEFTHSVSLLNFTGALYSKLGDQLSALPYLKTAASLNQESAEVWCNLGSVQNSLGDTSAAIDSYQRAIKASPDEATIHFNLANCLKSLGEGELAVESYRRALELDPQYAAAFNNLGLALQSLSFFDEAAQSFREAIDLVPYYTEALLNLAAIQFETGDLDKCVITLNRTIELNPNLAEIYFIKGNVFRNRGAYQDAVDQFYKALEIDSCHFAALSNLSEVLLKCGKSAESLKVAERAIAINPSELRAPHNNRGAALKELGRYSEALVSYKKAIEIEPESGEGYYNISIILANLCKFDEALSYYEMAIAARPDHIDVHSNKLFTLNYHPTKTADEIYCNYVEFNDKFSANYSPIWRKGDHNLNANRILRIGYLSPDFRSHSASRFLEPLFDTHDKSKFEIYAYSAVVHEDVITDYLKSKTHTWTSTLDLDDKTLAETIARDKIDILIDLAGHTKGHRLLMMAVYKPA